ncbi:hypothetical protein HJB78_00885 [Rhizobium lentis]|uniref:hypothetical protein n=1 Tax=Rhizobium lentis TaxID=1138194 RepID=UPI001C83248A|nr:hypothetical protein [Rhizobium lentis]MBX5149560.1 hypothetical protein [Rhizobium lentis]
MRPESHFNSKEKLAIKNVVFRDWSPFLTSTERHIVYYILDQSIEWGHRSFDATFKQMAEGQRDWNGQRWRLAPINMARTTFYDTLEVLKERGVVSVQPIERRCTIFTLNLDWRPAEGVISAMDAVRALPADEEDGLSGSRTTHIREPDPIKQNIKQNYNPPYSTNKSAAPPSGSAAVNPFPKERTDDTTPERKKPTTVPAAPARELKETYRQAWEQAYPDIPVITPTQRDFWMLKQTLNARLRRDVTAQHDFVHFVVRNWAQIMSVKFGWMNRERPPRNPKIGFIIAGPMIGHFLDAFAERRRFETAKLLSHYERDLDCLVGGGMHRDDALITIGKRNALSVHDDEKREVRRLNGDMIRRAEEARAKAVAAQKALMRQRAEAKKQPEETQYEGFPELGEYTFEPIELPPIDHSKWS